MFALLCSVASAKSSQNHKKQGWQPHVPKVIVTIKPIHSLVSAVMEGIGQPQLLIQGNTSPHGHALKPSEADSLDKAEVIIWVGPSYETSMQYKLKGLEDKKIIINLSKASHVKLYPQREGRFWGTGACCGCDNCLDDKAASCHCHKHSEDHVHETTSKDGHLWLAPDNAKAIVTEVTKTLSTLDPQHAPDYLANSKKVLAKLNDLAKEITDVVRPIKGVPYMMMHDFSQYFDRYYGTNGVGTILDGSHKDPTPQTIRKIETKLTDGQAICIFTEPQLGSRVTEMLIEESGVATGELDYLGLDLEPGPDCYFQIIRRLANNMVKYLEK